jgi:ribose transport system substrate-binding protein
MMKKTILRGFYVVLFGVLVPQVAPAASPHKPFKIAFLGSTPANLYDEAILEGSIDAVADKGSSNAKYEVVPFYSNFNIEVQSQQCFEVVASEEYAAIIAGAATATGLIPCVAAAGAAGIPVIAVDVHMGDDVSTSEVQVEGQTGAVLVPPAEVGQAFAELAVERCIGIDPCQVVYIGGLFAFVVDQLALQELEATAALHPNIELVAVAEGFYSADIARGITSELLASGVVPDIILHGGDQMAMGSEQAISEAGIAPGQIDLVGGGAGAYGVQAIRDGRWYATFVTLPYDEGYIAAQMAMRAIVGAHIKDTGVNPVIERGIPYMLTRDNLATFAEFMAQWPG